MLPTVLFVMVAVAAGLAYGYWGGSGSGTSSAAAPVPVAVTLSPGTPAATLIPGGQTDVVLNVSNPNVYPVHFGSLILDTAQGSGGFAVDAGHPACIVATLSFTTQTLGGAGWIVPAKVGTVNGALAITLTNALAMAVDAANACQGATFAVYLKAT